MPYNVVSEGDGLKTVTVSEVERKLTQNVTVKHQSTKTGTTSVI